MTEQERRGCLTVLQTWHGAGLGYCPAAWILHLPTRGAGVPRSGNGARAHKRKGEGDQVVLSEQGQIRFETTCPPLAQPGGGRMKGGVG